MASEKQIAANRLNSQKSTGPRSESGKSVSRMNALQTGLHAESHIIRGEAAEALAELTAEYYAEFRPVTARQRDLVDTVVHNQWLIRRLRLTEADLHAKHFQYRDDEFEEKWRFKVLQKEHPLADAFESLEKRLLRLQSRLNSLERSTRAALKEFTDLRNSGTGDEIPPSDFVACPPIAPSREPVESIASAPIGFVPLNGDAAPPTSPTGFVPAESPHPVPSDEPIHATL